MLKHVVCFKSHEGESPEKAKEVLLSMQGNVPMLKGIEVGIDELHSARSYDVMLSVLLEDMQALDAYQKDEYHVSVVKKHMHKVAANTFLEATHETPHGKIGVTWKKDGETLSLTIEKASGLKGKLFAPDGWFFEDGDAEKTLGSGNYALRKKIMACIEENTVFVDN